MYEKMKLSWFSNLKGDTLAGIVVALALIPEAIAFSIIAGVDPKVGLYASFAICGDHRLHRRTPGMISAATGAMAMLMITLVGSRARISAGRHGAGRPPADHRRYLKLAD